MWRAGCIAFVILCGLAVPLAGSKAQPQVAPAGDDAALATFHRGLADAKDGKFEAAIGEFDQAIHLKPALAEAYDARGQAYEALHQERRAFSDYDQAVALKPDLAEAVSHRARLAGALNLSLTPVFDLSSNQQPTSAEMFKARGLAYMRAGKKQEAIGDFDQVIKLKPDDAEAFKNRGSAYRDLGQYQKALEDYDQALKLKPDDAGVFVDRGFTYGLMGDKEKAARDFQDAVRSNPNMAEAHYDLGNSYLDRQQYADAIANYSEAVRLKPDYVLAFINRGNAYRRLQRLPEAVADYDRTLAISPGDPMALENRGLIYLQMRRPELARGDFSRARDAYDTRIKADPKNRIFQQGRADSAWLANRWKDAVADYTSYVALNDTAPIPAPEMAHAYVQRGWAKWMTGDEAGGMADVEAALRLKPDVENGRWRHAWLLRAEGRYQEALKDFDAEVDRKTPRAYFNRAVTYFCLDMYREAEEDMRRYIEITKISVDTPAIWVHIFRLKQGVADDGFVDKKPPVAGNGWVVATDNLFRGRQSLEETETAMQKGRIGPWGNDNWPCPVHFFLGEYRLEHGDVAGARTDLASITPANCDWADAAAAVAELKRLPAN